MLAVIRAGILMGKLDQDVVNRLKLRGLTEDGEIDGSAPRFPPAAIAPDGTAFVVDGVNMKGGEDVYWGDFDLRDFITTAEFPKWWQRAWHARGDGRLYKPDVYRPQIDADEGDDSGRRKGDDHEDKGKCTEDKGSNDGIKMFTWEVRVNKLTLDDIPEDSQPDDGIRVLIRLGHISGKLKPARIAERRMKGFTKRWTIRKNSKHFNNPIIAPDRGVFTEEKAIMSGEIKGLKRSTWSLRSWDKDKEFDKWWDGLWEAEGERVRDGNQERNGERGRLREEERERKGERGEAERGISFLVKITYNSLKSCGRKLPSISNLSS